MAETLPGNSFILKQGVIFNRPFFFGTTGQAGTMVVTLSKNGTAFVATTNTATEITPASGWYNLALSVTDTNTSGILAYHVTATTGGPADFSDIVQATIFTDLVLTGSGLVIANNAIRQNQPFPAFPFQMTKSGVPLPGIAGSILVQRNLGGSGWTSIGGGGIVDQLNGAYTVNLVAADTNSPSAMYLFTAPTADANLVIVLPSP